MATLVQRASGAFIPLRLRIVRIFRALLPGLAGGFRGLGLGLLGGATLLVAASGLTRFTGLGVAVDVVGSALAFLAFVLLVGKLAVLVLKGIKRMLIWLVQISPRLVHWLPRALLFIFKLLPEPMVDSLAGIGALVLIYILAPDSAIQIILPQTTIVPVLILEGVVGLVVGAAAGWKARRFVMGGLVGLAAVAHIAVVIFMALPGSDSHLAKPVQIKNDVALALPDPGKAGLFSVEVFSYGSGKDRHQPEYADKASWLTQPVSASTEIYRYNNFAGAYYKWFWGFDFSELPLNALVWSPQGSGPFPLVLIVHGNHAMGDFSESGYEYLGRHLASQGYITVSLDENFLNGSWVGQLNTEYGLRAWMMLKHLELWQTWNTEPTHPFYGRVDMNRIALMGHSRGGQAAVLAAAINQVETPIIYGVSEDLSALKFKIKAVVSIAPNEGSFSPNGAPAAFSDTSYLLLQGGHDADVSTIQGIRQYQRVQVEGGADVFKAVVYSYRANHGLFNTVWMYGDAGLQLAWVLNLKPLLQPADQQMVGKVFITAFLKASLNGESAYRELFRSPWKGAGWLPGDIVLTRYQDAGFRPLQSFKAYTSVSDVRIDGVSTNAENFSLSKVEELRLRDEKSYQSLAALRLRWESGSGAAYSLALPDSLAKELGLGSSSRFSFNLGHAVADQQELDLTIELVDMSGQIAALPLSALAPVQPPLVTNLVKSDEIASQVIPYDVLAFPFERLLQTYSLPLGSFRQANPQFDPSSLVKITLRFDRTPAGDVYLDQIGFAPGE